MKLVAKDRLARAGNGVRERGQVDVGAADDGDVRWLVHAASLRQKRRQGCLGYLTASLFSQVLAIYSVIEIPDHHFVPSLIAPMHFLGGVGIELVSRGIVM